MLKESDSGLIDRLTIEVGAYGLRRVADALVDVAREAVVFLSNHPEVPDVAKMDVEEWARAVIILETAERAIARLDMDDIPY